MSSVKLGSLLAGGLLAASGGCATSSRPGAVPPDPERTILELRAKNAGYVRRIEELENRVFILEDQLDSRALASEQRAPATLPSRGAAGLPTGATTAPAGGGRGAPDQPAGGAVQTSLLAEHAVDYAGDAVEGVGPPGTAPAPEGRRPMLRLSAASRAPEPRSEERTAVAAARPAADPLKLYRESLEILRAGHADAARVGFRRFLDANPQHDYADNAQYWIGECDYAAENFAAAERAFRTVVERYPRGNKVPDAMLKLGFTLQAMGDAVGGRAVLESLMQAFPRHEAARLAATRLVHPSGGAGAGAAGWGVSARPPGGDGKILGTMAPGAAVPAATRAGRP